MLRGVRMFKRARRVGVAIAAFFLPISSAWSAEFNAAKAFGARDMVRQASLSPDGRSVALIQPVGDGQVEGLFIAAIEGERSLKPILLSKGHRERLFSCGWVSNSRLVCNVGIIVDEVGMRLHYTRLLAIDANGENLRVVSARRTGQEYSFMQYGGDVVDWLAEDSSGSILMTRDFAQEYSTGTMLANDREGLGLEKVDTVSLKRVRVEPPKDGAVDYIGDQHGSVRIMVQQARTSEGYQKAQFQFFSRPQGGGPWTPFSTYDDDSHVGFRPIAVDRDMNAAYGLEWLNGHQAVVRVSLDGSKTREVILARSDVDVDELIRIGRQRRVVGVSFATDKRQAIFFDPALKALAAALSKALPDQPQIRFVDASLDENRLLVWAGSDVQPGRYYLYDKAGRKLSPLIEERPQLSGVKLAPVQAVRYQASDGASVPAYLTLPRQGPNKNIPAIVLPHGGPGARDEWGFDWLAQFFAARGYAVLQPNFRGSSGYGEAWFQDNGFQSWRTAIGDVNDAGRWLQSQGIAAPDKMAIFGWSYGGYAALQSSVLDPDLFKAVVAVAPVTDLDALREQSRNFTNFKLVDAYIGHGAHVREGSPAQNAEKIKAPVLMFHGDEDDNVDVAQSKLMLSRLKAAGAQADLVVYPGLDHQLNEDKARTEMLDRADQFIREALKL